METALNKSTTSEVIHHFSQSSNGEYILNRNQVDLMEAEKEKRGLVHSRLYGEQSTDTVEISLAEDLGKQKGQIMRPVSRGCVDL